MPSQLPDLLQSCWASHPQRQVLDDNGDIELDTDARLSALAEGCIEDSGALYNEDVINDRKTGFPSQNPTNITAVQGYQNWVVTVDVKRRIAGGSWSKSQSNFSDDNICEKRSSSPIESVCSGSSECLVKEESEWANCKADSKQHASPGVDMNVTTSEKMNCGVSDQGERERLQRRTGVGVKGRQIEGRQGNVGSVEEVCRGREVVGQMGIGLDGNGVSACVEAGGDANTMGNKLETCTGHVGGQTEDSTHQDQITEHYAEHRHMNPDLGLLEVVRHTQSNTTPHERERNDQLEYPKREEVTAERGVCQSGVCVNNCCVFDASEWPEVVTRAGGATALTQHRQNRDENDLLFIAYVALSVYLLLVLST